MIPKSDQSCEECGRALPEPEAMWSWTVKNDERGWPDRMGEVMHPEGNGGHPRLLSFVDESFDVGVCCPCGAWHDGGVEGGLELVGDSHPPYPDHLAPWIGESDCGCGECELTDPDDAFDPRTSHLREEGRLGETIQPSPELVVVQSNKPSLDGDIVEVPDDLSDAKDIRVVWNHEDGEVGVVPGPAEVAKRNEGDDEIEELREKMEEKMRDDEPDKGGDAIDAPPKQHIRPESPLDRCIGSLTAEDIEGDSGSLNVDYKFHHIERSDAQYEDQDEQSKPSPDIMMYLHERYGVEPRFEPHDEGKCWSDEGGRYRSGEFYIELQSVTLRFEQANTGEHKFCAAVELQRLGCQVGINFQSLESACDEADTKARELLREDWEALGE